MPCYDSVPPSALRPLISPLPGRVALIGAWLCIIIVHVSQACCSLRSDSRRSRCSALGSSLPASSGSTFELGTETQGYPTAYTAHEAASLYRNISRGVVRFLSPKQSTHERQGATVVEPDDDNDGRHTGARRSRQGCWRAEQPATQRDVCAAAAAAAERPLGDAGVLQPRARGCATASESDDNAAADTPALLLPKRRASG
jgi:hypothetical protein